ncbi:MAG: HD domain-containing protein [Pyrinomonadaceae bacterium]|nr:HD domain-containing protein [Pyrinomonadaceae bacterium]
MSDFDSQILTLADSIDKAEGYSCPHAVRIAILSDRMAVAFGFTDYDREVLWQASLLHDIGEMVMNRSYLKENRALYEEERLDMQRHPIIGEQELARRNFPKATQLLVRWHHEWWNGTGYPDALEREEIPLSARILRVADSFVSMTAMRSYRAAFSEEETKEYIRERAGVEFDPTVVKVFFELGNIEQIFEELESSVQIVRGDV